jgi:hypothetical protein
MRSQLAANSASQPAIPFSAFPRQAPEFPKGAERGLTEAETPERLRPRDGGGPNVGQVDNWTSADWCPERFPREEIV